MAVGLEVERESKNASVVEDTDLFESLIALLDGLDLKLKDIVESDHFIVKQGRVLLVELVLHPLKVLY